MAKVTMTNLTDYPLHLSLGVQLAPRQTVTTVGDREKRKAAEAVARHLEQVLGLRRGRLRVRLVGDDGVDFVATPPLPPHLQQDLRDLLRAAWAHVHRDSA